VALSRWRRFLIGAITLKRGPTFIISTSTVLLAKILDTGLHRRHERYQLAAARLARRVCKFPFYYAMLARDCRGSPSYAIRRSKFGLGLRAISQDETKAEVAGIPTRFYKILAFALSGLFIGMAGALWGYYLTYLSPVIFLSILVGA
jgi:branched-chain amino acid transport system permease protein